jgi:hypothetical protein
MNETLLLIRLKDILCDCDKGKITDSQAIKKLMKSYTKYNQSRFKELKGGKDEIRQTKTN